MMWDDKLCDIVKTLSDKYDIPEGDIKYAIDHLFKTIRFYLRLPTIPKVLIHNFGTFSTSTKRLTYMDRKIKRRVEQELMTQEDADLLLAKQSNVRERLLKEQPNLGYNQYLLSCKNPDKKILNDDD